VTHFAIPDGEFSPVEAEFASILDDDTPLIGSFAPVGLVLVTRDLSFSILLLALATGLDIDQWWTR
jgi:hypothetical protein